MKSDGRHAEYTSPRSDAKRPPGITRVAVDYDGAAEGGIGMSYEEEKNDYKQEKYNTSNESHYPVILRVKVMKC